MNKIILFKKNIFLEPKNIILKKKIETSYEHDDIIILILFLYEL